MKKPGKMLSLIMDSLFRKPATVLYPHEKVSMPKNFRGKIRFVSEKCIGCKLCMKDCPSWAIEIKKVADKKFDAEFNLARCIYCAQCVDTCPKKALEHTEDYELAQLDPKKLKCMFHAITEIKDSAPPSPVK
jgi:formate hydrogenlyase subunit 6/NADH:ubiquinone oxidoreductase subunit I